MATAPTPSAATSASADAVASAEEPLETEYRGFRPALARTVQAFDAAQVGACHTTQPCHSWVETFLETMKDAPRQSNSAWGASAAEHIAGILNDPLRETQATLQQLACSDTACAIEVTYPLPDLPVHWTDTEMRLLNALTKTPWFTSQFVLDATGRDSPGGLGYTGYQEQPPTMDMIYLWYRKQP